MKERNDLIHSEEFLRSVSLHKKNILISFRNFLIFWTLFSFVSGLAIYYFSGQTITIKEILFFFLLGTVLVGISTICRYLSKYKVLEITISDKKMRKNEDGVYYIVFDGKNKFRVKERYLYKLLEKDKTNILVCRGKYILDILV